MLTLLRQQAAALKRDGQLLAALSHRGVLARGFALVRDLDGAPLRLAAAVEPGMPLDIEFADGRVRVRAAGAATAQTAGAGPDAPAKPRGRRGGDSGQGSLFG
jgi:exodeoxyribonuclease VII large subunit